MSSKYHILIVILSLFYLTIPAMIQNDETIETVTSRLKVNRLPANHPKQYVPCMSVSVRKKCADLIEAVQCGCRNHVAEFVQVKNTLDSKDNQFGNTPLHWALYLSDIQMACTLLEAGAKHDIKNKAGKIPLDCFDCIGLNCQEQEQLCRFYALARSESIQDIDTFIEQLRKIRNKSNS